MNPLDHLSASCSIRSALGISDLSKVVQFLAWGFLVGRQWHRKEVGAFFGETLDPSVAASTPILNDLLAFIRWTLISSDVQGFVNPPRVKGRGQQGKGQGKDFLTPNKPLTLLKGQGFFRGFSGVFQGFLFLQY